MIETLIVILVVLWLLGLVTAHTMVGFSIFSWCWPSS